LRRCDHPRSLEILDSYGTSVGEILKLLPSDGRAVIGPRVVCEVFAHTAHAKVHQRLASAVALDLIGTDDRQQDRLKPSV
jgi:hypothetical protein